MRPEMSRCEENANGQAWDSQWDHRMEKVCKLILVGNGSVGKTSICQRFKDDGFLKVYRQTIGVDFLEKKLELRPGHTSILQVWDIGGQSINSKMVGGYVSGSSVVFVCYDVTDRSSFGDSLDWLRVARQHVAPIDGQNPQIYLVGNKIDLIHLRKVTPEEHDKFVLDNNLDGGFFISAQSGENVLTTFYKAAASVSGIELTAHELAFTEKVLSVTVTRETDGERAAGMSEELKAIERADAEAAERHKRQMERARQGGGDTCKCAVQ